MCLGVPGEVQAIEREDGLLMGRVAFGGVSKRVCLEHVPEVQPGDFVLVHVGFALARLDAEEARRTLALLADLGQLGEVEAPAVDAPGEVAPDAEAPAVRASVAEAAPP